MIKYSWVTMTGSKRFPFSSLSEANSSRYSVFHLSPMWAWKTLELYVICLSTLKSYTCSPYMPAPDDTCFGNGRNSKSQNHTNTKLRVLVRFHWILYHVKHNWARNTVKFFLNFQKQTCRTGKVYYFSIVIVWIYSVWVPKSASLFK